MSGDTFKVGPIRPPSEANSLLLQVTENCSWNKCKFCMLYKGHAFRTRPVDEIKADIDVMAGYRDMILAHEHNGVLDEEALNRDFHALPSFNAKMNYQMVFTWLTQGGREAIFLQDANTIVLRPEWLVDIVSHIKKNFPELNRITSYGRADALARISLEDMKRIREAGLDRIHSGFESGSDNVLKLIDKGVTQEQEILGGQKVKAAGMELSIYFMPGVGGKEYSQENATETAQVINAIDPDFVRLRTFVLRIGSLMDDLRKEGKYRECTDMEKLLEIRELVANIDAHRVKGRLTSDHIINLLPRVEGRMDRDLPGILEYIDGFLQLPKEEQKIFQLARRMGSSLDYKDITRLRSDKLEELRKTVGSVPDGKKWEELLHTYMDRYI